VRKTEGVGVLGGRGEVPKWGLRGTKERWEGKNQTNKEGKSHRKRQAGSEPRLQKGKGEGHGLYRPHERTIRRNGPPCAKAKTKAKLEQGTGHIKGPKGKDPSTRGGFSRKKPQKNRKTTEGSGANKIHLGVELPRTEPKEKKKNDGRREKKAWGYRLCI